MLVRIVRQLALVGSASGLLACGAPQQSSFLQGAVSFEQLQTAVHFIFAVDYLPFTDIADGCFARSLYMVMELAILGIPVSSQFVIATSGSLSPQPNFKWNYHVAPAVWVKDFSEPSILDPSMFDHVSGRSAWINKLNPTGTYELKFAPASETVVSSSTLRAGPQARSEMLSTVDGIGEFRESDITNSCRTMETSIRSESSLTAAEQDLKKSRLTKRTKFLLTELKKLGLGPQSSFISDDPDTCY